jgi:hypothetical protein
MSKQSTRSAKIAYGILAVLSSATAMPAMTPYSTNSSSAGTPTWQDCSSIYGPGFTCANYSVPIDWNAAAGEKITLGMNRYHSNSSGTASKQNLFVNFGGPGAITTQTLAETITLFSEDITDHFDLSM